MASWANSDFLTRYQRQVVLPQIGFEGQSSLKQGRSLIVGLDGLGSWVAELLARAGVGFLRLADDDVVELVNIQRQALYGEAIKLLSGHSDADNPYLLRFDLWRNEAQRLNFRVIDEGKTSCICCVRYQYEFLEPCSALQFLLPRRRND
jgi:hypothetical protein